jgi:hypothetical protein
LMAGRGELSGMELHRLPRFELGWWNEPRTVHICSTRTPTCNTFTA